MGLSYLLALVLWLPVSREQAPVIPTGNDSLSVYVFLEDECLISQFFTTELNRLFENYHTRHVGFVGYFPGPATRREAITLFADSFKIKFPLLPDPAWQKTKELGATVTPEVVVWDHRSDRLIYRGRIDDSYARVGKRRLHPQSHDLEDMISSWLENNTPETMVRTQAIGCFISIAH